LKPCLNFRSMQIQLSRKASKQIQKLRLAKQFEKQKALFLSNPFHPSLVQVPIEKGRKNWHCGC
jgi:hypothetical protein